MVPGPHIFHMPHRNPAKRIEITMLDDGDRVLVREWYPRKGQADEVQSRSFDSAALDKWALRVAAALDLPTMPELFATLTALRDRYRNCDAEGLSL